MPKKEKRMKLMKALSKRHDIECKKMKDELRKKSLPKNRGRERSVLGRSGKKRGKFLKIIILGK